MIVKIKIFTILLLGTIWLAGCSSHIGDDERENSNPEDARILLYSPNTAETVITRLVADDFPNNKSIGVIGALYNETGIQWNAYSDLNNVPATAISVDGDVFNFDWITPKYWPFDGTQLVFMAYSPFTENTAGSSVNISDSREALTITLQENMPDMMYASGNVNAAETPYNKLSGKVNLGEFRHIMSRLTVEVVPQQGMNPAIRISNLTVSTSSHEASFFLAQGDEGLSVIDTPTNNFTYTLVNTPPFATIPVSETVQLFPGTEETVRIMIGLIDTSTNNSIDQVFLISSFDNITNSGEPLTLERAKNTTLRIEIASVPVREDEDQIILKGTLTDWNEKGNFGIHIN